MVIIQKVGTIIARTYAQKIVVEAARPRSRTRRKAKACIAKAFKHAREEAEAVFTIAAQCCYALARLASIKQCELTEHFARLLICTYHLPEEDGVEYIAVHTADWTSEGKGTSEQGKAVHIHALTTNEPTYQMHPRFCVGNAEYFYTPLICNLGKCKKLY